MKTGRKMRTEIQFLLVLMMVLSLISVPISGISTNEVHQETVISEWGVEYTLTFFEGNLTVVVRGENPTDDWQYAGYVVEVDGRVQYNPQVNLSREGSFRHKFKISESLDILSPHHSIYFSTFGADTRFNFTKEIDYRNSTRFPKPQITNVTIANGTVDGEPSTVAYVTVSNPTNQLYSMKLLVHTRETQGGLYGGSTPEYTNRTVKVELLEERGSTVAGEIRLYVGEPSEREGGLDQVEFVGRPDGETSVYNRSYEPATGPWAEDSYAYRNESVGDGNGWLPDSASGPVVKGLAAVGLVVAAVVLMRRWR